MTILQAIILGALQGITEFLPVSSSGHLVVMKSLLHLSEIPPLFDVLLHISTLAVVCIVFRKKIGAVAAALFRGTAKKQKEGDRENIKLFFIIIAATVVTVICGYAISFLHVEKSPKIVSVLFIATACVLIGTRFVKGGREYGDIGLKEGLFVGFAQGLGVFPGISRSGITISASLYGGLSREKAGEFSFLISIPAIIGAFVVTLRDAEALGAMISGGVLAAGIAASFVVGFFSLLLLLRLVRGGRLYFFALYLVPLGVIGLIFL
jgi:undecaprenyl-diphosphatase